MPDGDSEDLSSKELAARLKVSVRTVQRWAQDGSIEPDWVTPGGQQRWSESRVRSQLRYRRSKPGSASD